jgi:hypothetical protein
MKLYIFLLTLVFSIISSSAKAETLYPCDLNCNSFVNEDYQIATGSPDGMVFSIIDIDDEIAKTYEVEVYYSNGAGEYFERAVQIATTQNALNALQSIKVKKSQIAAYSVQIPTSIADTAYDIITSPSVRDDIGNFIPSDLDLIDLTGSYAGMLLVIFNKLNIIVRLEVEFADGSTANYDMTGLTQDFGLIYTYEEGSATNSDGHSIASTPSQLLGTHIFPNEDNQARFAGVADKFGIIITQNQSCVPIAYTICTTLNGVKTCNSYTTCF